MSKPDPLWVNGTCDRIVDVLTKWIMEYHEKGTVIVNGKAVDKVSATCKKNSKPGPRGIEVTEVPRRYACEVAWQRDDLDYFIKILENKIPTNAITRDWRRDFPLWKNGRIVQGGARIVVMDVYFEDLAGLYNLMGVLRNGKFQEEKPDLASVDLSTFK